MRCSYCGGRGHNIRGCTKLKEDAKSDPCSWAAMTVRHWAAMTGRKKRRCSYCGSREHTKPKCLKLKHDLAFLARSRDDWALAFIDHLKKEYPGFGPGALVRQKAHVCDLKDAGPVYREVFISYLITRLDATGLDPILALRITHEKIPNFIRSEALGMSDLRSGLRLDWDDPRITVYGGANFHLPNEESLLVSKHSWHTVGQRHFKDPDQRPVGWFEVLSPSPAQAQDAFYESLMKEAGFGTLIKTSSVESDLVKSLVYRSREPSYSREQKCITKETRDFDLAGRMALQGKE